MDDDAQKLCWETVIGSRRICIYREGEADYRVVCGPEAKRCDFRCLSGTVGLLIMTALLDQGMFEGVPSEAFL